MIWELKQSRLLFTHGKGVFTPYDADNDIRDTILIKGNKTIQNSMVTFICALHIDCWGDFICEIIFLSSGKNNTFKK